MANLRDFYKHLLLTMTEQASQKCSPFRRRFNNAPEYRTSRNCLPRTTLMLGRGGDRRSGIVPQAIKKSWPDEVTDSSLSFDRYMDVVAFVGNWWEGESVALLAVEIENNINEFAGTVSDLLRYQARHKVAVLYDAAARSKKTEFQDKALCVFDRFNRQGFSEAADTEYLLAFGPNELEGIDIGDWCAMWFTRADRSSITWL